jgi:RNA-directed DNA polymerase
MAYYAVPGNARAVRAFRDQALAQGAAAPQPETRINWPRMHRIATRWLPPAREMHPFPEARVTALAI